MACHGSRVKLTVSLKSITCPVYNPILLHQSRQERESLPKGAKKTQTFRMDSKLKVANDGDYCYGGWVWTQRERDDCYRVGGNVTSLDDLMQRRGTRPKAHSLEEGEGEEEEEGGRGGEWWHLWLFMKTGDVRVKIVTKSFHKHHFYRIKHKLEVMLNEIWIQNEHHFFGAEDRKKWKTFHKWEMESVGFKGIFSKAKIQFGLFNSMNWMFKTMNDQNLKSYHPVLKHSQRGKKPKTHHTKSHTLYYSTTQHAPSTEHAAKQ